MDNAVALVQTYLRLNGYFTVTEFPVIEAMRRGGHRTATDIDVLAFRFPHAGRLVPREGRSGTRDTVIDAPDPALGVPPDAPDMLIGEVKEGRAELNSAATDPAVLRAVLVRFGCCRQPDVDATVQDLVRHGRAETSPGHTTRLVAFGAHAPEGRSPRYSIVLLETVTTYLESYISSNWDVLRHAEFKDPAFGFLVTLFKSGHGRWKAHRG
ncbi:MAG: hypothetical protein KDK91_06595 [Gammaproteobacteria bacterium]|nr:hypothetical protein [Gammaproteobacteria bacterium]